MADPENIFERVRGAIICARWGGEEMGCPPMSGKLKAIYVLTNKKYNNNNNKLIIITII